VNHQNGDHGHLITIPNKALLLYNLLWHMLY